MTQPPTETPADRTPAPTPPPAPSLTTDILGEPWVARRIAVTPDEAAAPGADHAVLVHQRGAVPPAGGAPRHERAVLYLHGRNDFFFQTHLADALLTAGYEFYALDLRACGRAGVDHPSPHDVRDLRVHDEEITEALRIIRTEHAHSGDVVLNGHSTGGLLAAIWAADHPGSVSALVLNSPWLQLNSSGLARSYGSAYVDLISRRDPEKIIGEDLYVRSLHRHWGGEWDWDLRLKPSPSFPVRAGFLAGIRRLQREVRHGLGLRIPVLVCCSTTTGGPGTDAREARRSDVVLSVEQIVERAGFLGSDVTIRQIPNGVHDLALSPSPAREEYLTTVTEWLTARLG